MVLSRLNILVTYSSRSRWCDFYRKTIYEPQGGKNLSKKLRKQFLHKFSSYWLSQTVVRKFRVVSFCAKIEKQMGSLPEVRLDYITIGFSSGQKKASEIFHCAGSSNEKR